MIIKRKAKSMWRNEKDRLVYLREKKKEAFYHYSQIWTRRRRVIDIQKKYKLQMNRENKKP